MQKVILGGLLFCILIVGGCVGLKTKEAMSMGSEVDQEPCTPVTYKKVSASAQKRPSWVMVEPPDDRGFHFLIGMSNYHATERDARDEAMRDARDEFARYTGVEVTQLDEIAKILYGSSSGILDPTVVGKTQSTQESNALFRRTRAREWYYETLHARCGGREMGMAYQYWVLAEVPAEEFDKVQEWKDRQEAVREAEKKAEQRRLGEKMEGLIRSHREALAEAESLMAKADPVGALTVLQGDWNHLYDAGKTYESKGSSDSAEVQRIISMQREIPPSVHKVRSSLIIDPGRGASVWIPEGEQKTAEIPVWAWYRRDSEIAAVSGLPLLLKMKEIGTIVARGRTNPDGLVKFQASGIRPGNYEIVVDTQEGTLVSLAPPLQESLTLVTASQSVNVYTPDMAGAAKAGVQQLFMGPSLKPLPATKVVMGSVRFGETRMGSDFGKRLETLIEREISQFSGMTLVRRQSTRNVEVLVHADKARGIGITDRPVLPMNSPAMQAQLDGAEASLEVSYFREVDHLNVDFRLIQAGTGQILASSGVSVPLAQIPEELQWFPPGVEDISTESISSAEEGPIRLELTTQRGDAATFAAGETIHFYVSTNRDAYLLLLYKDASNNLVQIYPNSRSGSGYHQAGDYIEVPDVADRFDFTIREPFGVEQVWAFAATAPLPSLKGKGLANGLSVIQLGLKEVTSIFREHGRKNGVGYGETNVMVTTTKE